MLGTCGFSCEVQVEDTCNTKWLGLPLQVLAASCTDVGAGAVALRSPRAYVAKNHQLIKAPNSSVLWRLRLGVLRDNLGQYQKAGYCSLCVCVRVHQLEWVDFR